MIGAFYGIIGNPTNYSRRSGADGDFDVGVGDVIRRYLGKDRHSLRRVGWVLPQTHATVP